MFEEDQKLRVPDPGDAEKADPDRSGVFVVAAAVSLLAGLAFVLYQHEYAGEGSGPTDGTAVAADGDGTSDLERRAERLRVLSEGSDGEEPFANYPWESRDALAAFRFGPRSVAERVCDEIFRRGADHLRTPRVSRELLSATDRLAVHAPWSCMYRVFFSDGKPLGDAVTRQLSQIWERLRTFDGPGRLIASVLRQFTADGFVPADAEFYRWLRLCALNFDTHEGGACRELLADIASRQGSDLLDTAESHLRETELNPTYDLPILMGGLRRLAAEGQPPGWRIVETDALPDYDSDLRIGAMFYLCRFVHSPDDQVAERASKALSRAADYGVRAGDSTRVPRWRVACRRAFGDETDDGDWRAPSLAVWTGDPEDPPRYPLEDAIERGDCRVRDGHPRWYCGAEAWNATEPEALTDFYVQTSDMEWEETGPLELE